MRRTFPQNFADRIGRPTAAVFGALLALVAPRPALAEGPQKDRTLEEYRTYRALFIDLVGRMPLQADLERFERSDFDMGHFVEETLRGPGYVERMTRMTMDALRLEANPLQLYTPAPATLFAETVRKPDGKLTRVFYRKGQRRLRAATDAEFCLTPGESGVDKSKPPADAATLPRVPQAALDGATVLVKPWWLYRDYRTPQPSERLGKAWSPARGFYPVKELTVEPDGETELVSVRVCREEAQSNGEGKLWVSERYGKKPLPPRAPERTTPPPYDDAWAGANRGQPIACSTQLALRASVDCGCGVGLERCLPQFIDYSPMFKVPARDPVGLEGAYPPGPNKLTNYQIWWWHNEALKLLDYVYGQDRDVRELVTGRYTFVNGPLAQFYRYVEPAACCEGERPLGMPFESTPLVLPDAIPDLMPHEAAPWVFVKDRGPRAAGLLTTPAFLQKFTSRRARAAAIHTGLLCKNFIADTSNAAPSKDPDLMTRPGCASCHTTLEPLAAYFTRIKEGSSTFLSLPAENPTCKVVGGRMSPACTTFYDPAFSNGDRGLLRGAYASRDHTEAGPVALGAELAASPDYVGCALDRVASSLLGRPLDADDGELRARLLARFAESGYRMRPLVRAIVLDAAYARAQLGASRPAAAPFTFVHPPMGDAGP